jgi:hypothetical protein
LLIRETISSKLVPSAAAAGGTRLGLHDAAFQDLAVQVHLAKLALGIGFVASVDHEVLNDQPLPRADSKSELRRVQQRQHDPPGTGCIT